MSSTFSPSRSPGSSRIQLIGVGGISRLRSSSLKKLPEPLRRAVADCLSSSSASSHHGSPFSTVVNEATRTLRDYLAAPATTDLAYNAILEHTIAERERSPAVVTRCVALLKRYLLSTLADVRKRGEMCKIFTLADTVTQLLTAATPFADAIVPARLSLPWRFQWPSLLSHHSAIAVMSAAIDNPAFC